MGKLAVHVMFTLGVGPQKTAFANAVDQSGHTAGEVENFRHRVRLKNIGSNAANAEAVENVGHGGEDGHRRSHP